jgi:hypothetical protein
MSLRASSTGKPAHRAPSSAGVERAGQHKEGGCSASSATIDLWERDGCLLPGKRRASQGQVEPTGHTLRM